MNSTNLKPLELEDLFQPREMYGKENARDFNRGTYIRKQGLKRFYSASHSEWVVSVSVALLELLAGCQWCNSNQIYFALQRRFETLSWQEFNAIMLHTAKSGEIEIRRAEGTPGPDQLRLIQNCAIY